MNLSVTTSLAKIAPKLSYDVLIENQQDGMVSAIVLALPDFKSSGATKEEALEKLIQLLQERKPEIVTLEIQPRQTEHLWMKFTGMFKDDPQFEKMLTFLKPILGLSNSNIGASRQNTGKVFYAKKRMNNPRFCTPTKLEFLVVQQFSRGLGPATDGYVALPKY
ncbi:MAG: hypothetical protein V7L05_11735 [Nostoc sp.]|uniref:type II toxin-antitoxin system HicB family antitoxin n=1 Tax=Nostoc sp. TaxID=1180 RepID=UPI002FFD2006